MRKTWRATLKSIASILLMLAGVSCSRSANENKASLASAATPTARSDSPDAEFVRLATEFYDSHTSKCGDTTIALVTWIDGSGSRIFEINKPIVRAKSLPVTDAERLNGLVAQASAWLEASALRSAQLNADSWSPWQETGPVNFRVLLVKRTDAPWQITPTYSQGGEDGSLEKFPCDGVPGHPARLAREESERRLAAQARQVGSETFKCGPVRDFSGYGTSSFLVTDANIAPADPRDPVGGLNTAVAFLDVQYFSKFDADRLAGPGIWFGERPYNSGGDWGLRFTGPSALVNRDVCYEAIATSYERWRARFPSVAKLPSLQADIRESAAGRQRREDQARQRQEELSADTVKLEGTDCSTESTSILVLANEQREFVLSPNRKCWTPWLVVAEGQRFGGTTERGGNVLMEVEFVDGTTREPFEDGPRTNVTLQKQLRKARFKSLGQQPVTVTFKVR